MKTKKIEFYPSESLVEHVIDYPEPASKFIPEWYRKTKLRIAEDHGPTKRVRVDYVNNLSIKGCMPFFDAITSGYVVTLPADVVFVDEKEYGSRVLWKVSYNVVGGHTVDQIPGMPISGEYSSTELWKWIFPFIIKTPPGYSCLFTHPTFSFDAPFKTMTGIVDTDSHIVPVNFPFLIKDGFVGKIEKGTPICQIIPFKRDAWKMEKKPFEEKILGAHEIFNSVIEKSYKNRFWHRKSYK